MKRAAIATVVVALAGSARADTPAPGEPVDRTIMEGAPRQPGEAAKPAAKPAPSDCQDDGRNCDQIAHVEAVEANLETKAPRKGLTFAGALGAGIMIGGDIGVGRGPSLSLRLGHVATRKTVITFELLINTALHKRAVDSVTLSDNNICLFAGAQRYTARSLWVRAAGGLSTLQPNVVAKTGMDGDPAHVGVGGLLGAGVDYVRWGYFVLGGEVFGMGSVTGDGFKLQLAFVPLNLSYY